MTNRPNIIRQLRLRAGLTQVELAKRLGCQQTRISELEVGRRSKRPKKRQRWSDKVFEVAAICGYTVVLTADGWRIESEDFALPPEAD